MNSLEITPQMLALVPIVAAIVQMIKRLPFADRVKAYLPLATIVIAIGILAAQKVPDPIMPGLLIGLTASGGFDLVKTPKKPEPPAPEPPLIKVD